MNVLFHRHWLGTSYAPSIILSLDPRTRRASHLSEGDLSEGECIQITLSSTPPSHLQHFMSHNPVCRAILEQSAPQQGRELAPKSPWVAITTGKIQRKPGPRSQLSPPLHKDCWPLDTHLRGQCGAVPEGSPSPGSGSLSPGPPRNHPAAPSEVLFTVIIFMPVNFPFVQTFVFS